MKKKVIALVLVSSLLSGIVVQAANYYYADLLGNQEEQMKDELMEFYEKKYKERSKQVHNDLVTYVETERQKLIEHFKPEIIKAVNHNASKRQNEHAEEIDNEVFRLKVEIYEMLEEELDYEFDFEGYKG